MKLRIVKEKSCKICCSNVKYLNRHLKLQHSNFDEKQYYDTFLKKLEAKELDIYIYPI